MSDGETRNEESSFRDASSSEVLGRRIPETKAEFGMEKWRCEIHTRGEQGRAAVVELEQWSGDFTDR